MSLVAYASSDSEEEEEISEAPKPTSISSIPSAPAKESKKKAIITIPSLDQFKEDDESDLKTNVKPKLQSGSGLFALLPPPKYSGSSVTESFKPHILTKKKSIAPASKNSHPKSGNQDNKSSTHSKPHSDPTHNDLPDKDNDESSEPVMDYFSLEATSDKNLDFPEVVSSTDSLAQSTLFSSLPKPVQNTESYFVPTSQQEVSSSSSATNVYQPLSAASNYDTQSWDENYQSPSSSSSIPTPILGDEAFKRLKGRRGMEDINIIDVHADDQLTGKDEWLMQSLTEEKVQRPSKRRHDMPTQQQKRKHQITYLAHQAKERELDLKNQWALNSRTRRETQAKYGF